MHYNIEKVDSHEIISYIIYLFPGECFDADDDNGRICGSITPDTVLYTLFRSKIETKRSEIR
jgi:hypothetical protein